MAKLSNIDLWNKLRASYPQFKSHTSEGTAELFTERGYEKLKNWDHTALQDFFELSMRVYLNKINISLAKDNLSNNGFGESYDMPWGYYIQRIAINSIKPISPKYKNLKNGDSPDQFVVRKPDVFERFWVQNFDYQSLLTMPDDFAYKQLFVAEYGMDDYATGLVQGLDNGYVIQKYENKLEAINSGINSTVTPLRETQKMVSALSDIPTDDELRNFILSVNNVVEAMEIGPQCNAFNAEHYSTVQDRSRLKLLIRPGIKNAIKVRTLSGAFNRDDLSFDVDLVVVPHFGGLVPYKEEGYETQLYPVYDELGAVIGFSETEGQKGKENVTVEEADVFWKDPNENTYAILADKGLISEFTQNSYRMGIARNEAGLYNNYWASSPNNSIIFDPIYNCVLFQKE